MSLPNPKQLENARGFLESINALDWDALAALMASDFRHRYLPGSIPPPDGKEFRGRDEFLGVLKFNLGSGKVFGPTKYYALNEVHGQDAVVFHVKSDGASVSGKAYHNEYMITFYFAGEKIVQMDEFFDSKYTSAFFLALREEVPEAGKSA